MSKTPLSHPKLCRLKAGMTQQQVADCAGVSRLTVMRVESGKQRPSLATATAIATAMNLTVTQVFPLAAFHSLPPEQLDQGSRMGGQRDGRNR